jgi:DNA-binding CsgD family transcriptional regulator
VLSLIAEGRETDEIARELCYSPRTVVGIVHGVTRRFRLRNTRWPTRCGRACYDG